MDFETDYPGAQVVKLEQNYRSTKTIIKAATQVIQNNTSRKDKTLWTENEEGARIVQLSAPRRARRSRDRRSRKSSAWPRRRATLSDFAIFYRTNAQSRQFEDVFRREKITYQIVGGLRFYDRKEIKDILSYFKVILNPADSVGLKRIINVPARGIGKNDDREDRAVHQMRETTGRRARLYWSALRSCARRDPSITSAGTARKLGQFVGLLER